MLFARKATSPGTTGAPHAMNPLETRTHGHGPASFRALAAMLVAISPGPASGQSDSGSIAAATLTDAQMSRAVSFICSPRSELREGAYAAGRRLGNDGKNTYLQILKKAETHYREQLAQSAQDARRGGEGFDAAWNKLESTRADAMKFLMTDHKKAARKIQELDGKFADVGKALEDARSEMQKVGGSEKMSTSLEVLAEIAVEQAWCRGDKLTRSAAAEAFRSEAVPEDLQARVRKMRQLQEADKALEEALTFNDKLEWPSSKHRDFAKTINHARRAMALSPLRLEEKLSLAAEGHSEEMKKLGYFAHESPVGKNKTPKQRTANAGFAGSYRGENIYFSSAGAPPEEAFRAWWESDGHRFNMFAESPTLLGVGFSGGSTHWTMLTGK